MLELGGEDLDRQRADRLVVLADPGGPSGEIGEENVDEGEVGGDPPPQPLKLRQNKRALADDDLRFVLPQPVLERVRIDGDVRAALLEPLLDRHGRFGRLLGQLERHVAQALQPGVCLDQVSGGWKISSTSTNTWFSKIALAQHVIRRLFPNALNAAAAAADRVHADWQRRPGCGRDAMCDRIRSDTGISCGSRYYPRGVTAFLWLSERNSS